MPDRDPLPWEQSNTPLARAFTRGLERADAAFASGTPMGDGAFGGNHRSTALLVSGMDVNLDELDACTDVMATTYLQVMYENVRRAAPADADQIATQVLRGLIVQALSIGAIQERLRAQDANGRPGLEDQSWPARPVAVEPRAAAGLTVAQLAELRRDSVQVVLDMEADRLDRAATALHSLGLHDVADDLERAGSRLRAILEDA